MLLVCTGGLGCPANWPAQDPEYHEFADRRAMLGVPNFWNVVSNLPFLLTGLLGLGLCVRAAPGERAPWLDGWERTAFAVFFVGVALTCFGSGYYHLWPENDTLFWDRLPMTLGFMAILAIVVGERAHPAWGKAALWPLVIAGVLSVVYWILSERAGSGDLRPYILVQFFPMLLILALLVFPPRYTLTRSYVAVLAWYLVAKVLESLDEQVFELTAGRMSGHALKHVAAAVATWWLYRMLVRRRPVEAS